MEEEPLTEKTVPEFWSVFVEIAMQLVHKEAGKEVESNIRLFPDDNIDGSELCQGVKRIHDC